MQHLIGAAGKCLVFDRINLKKMWHYHSNVSRVWGESSLDVNVLQKTVVDKVHNLLLSLIRCSNKNTSIYFSNYLHKFIIIFYLIDTACKGLCNPCPVSLAVCLSLDHFRLVHFSLPPRPTVQQTVMWQRLPAAARWFSVSICCPAGWLIHGQSLDQMLILVFRTEPRSPDDSWSRKTWLELRKWWGMRG